MFKNYTINQTILPLDMEQYIPEINAAFVVDALVEAMAQTLFLELEEQLGRPAYQPKMILKIILYAYRFCCKVFQKIYFSVKLRKKTERTE